MDKIDLLLTRAVDHIIPSQEDLEKVLRSGKKLRVYQGFDPTGTQMHIGHMIGLRKLRQFQDLGHHVIFLIGDGTGQAGDPSGKLKARDKFMTREELRKNAKDYVMQASKIVRFEGENAAEILYNGNWLNKLTLPEILEIFGHFTLQQLSERDLFKERMKRNEPVNLREFVYPLLQAYDSVEMKVDLEIGGSDQTFNMLCGRTLVKEMLSKGKFVLTTPLLADSQGNKIGKTEGNVIALTDPPNQLFGEIMSLSDDIIIKGLEYLSDVPQEEIQNTKKAIKSGQNPLPFKKRLAFEVVKQLNGEEAAQKAQSEFESVFQKKQKPDEIESIRVEKAEINLVEFLVNNRLAESRSAAKRLLDQGAIEIDGQTIKDQEVEFKEGQVVKIGKRRFVKIEVQ